MDDLVNHPRHYNADSLVECIDAAGHLPFPLGSALKYLCRAGRKEGQSAAMDVAKAVWYLRWWFRHGYPDFHPGARIDHIGERLSRHTDVPEIQKSIQVLTGNLITAHQTAKMIDRLSRIEW